jgi:hypothetical protein
MVGEIARGMPHVCGENTDQLVLPISLWEVVVCIGASEHVVLEAQWARSRPPEIPPPGL